MIEKIETFNDELLKNLYEDFKKSTYFVNSLIGLSFERSIKAFLFVVYGIHDNVETIVNAMKPLYSQDVSVMKAMCCDEEKKIVCQFCKPECEWKTCTYFMKDNVFCPAKK